MSCRGETSSQNRQKDMMNHEIRVYSQIPIEKKKMISVWTERKSAGR